MLQSTNRGTTGGRMAFFLVVREYTTVMIMTIMPTRMTAYADGSPKPTSAAVENPTMRSAAPTMIRILVGYSVTGSISMTEDVQANEIKGFAQLSDAGTLWSLQLQGKDQKQQGDAAGGKVDIFVSSIHRRKQGC